MRILVVGDSFAISRATTIHLARGGHAIVLLSPRPLTGLPPHVTMVTGDADQPSALRQAIKGCDAVVYCPRSSGSIKAQSGALGAAMDQGGVSRLVIAVPPGAAGDAERMSASRTDIVFARVPLVIGRHAGEDILAFASGARRRSSKPEWLQVAHAEDVGRFLGLACEGGQSGQVDVVADGHAMSRHFSKTLLRAATHLPASLPVLDPTAMKTTWGFTCAWTAEDAVADTRLATEGSMLIGGRGVARPSRRQFFVDFPRNDEPTADGYPLVPGSAEDLCGEFDSPIDARFPTYVSTNLPEILPGPATPLSLTLIGRGTQAAGAAAAELVGMTGVPGREAACRFQGIFGHRLYMNVSCAVVLAEMAPGWDVEAITEQFLGRHAHSVPLRGTDPVPVERMTVRRRLSIGAGMGVRALGIVVGFKRDVDVLAEETARLEAMTIDLPALDQERLEALTWLAQDLQIHAWAIAGRGAVLAGIATEMATKLARQKLPGIGAGQGPLPSAAALLGVRRLANLAAQSPKVAELLSNGGTNLYDRIQAVDPGFSRSVDEALVAFGHRGPSEAELANRTFVDDPDLLLQTVAKAMLVEDRSESVANETVPVPARVRPVLRYAFKVTAERERCRDRVIRLVSILRRLVREEGRRLEDRGVLLAQDDVFYLTGEELFHPPGDAIARVERRRRERSRLAELHLPVAFFDHWQAEKATTELVAGEQLEGVGASPGHAEGVVRIVDAESVYDLQPGEVLVANVTDVGYTPMFGHAAAVITDIGGSMSHAAIVAREFGIPAVVGTGNGTARLATGMRVAVDGGSGVVTRVTPD